MSKAEFVYMTVIAAPPEQVCEEVVIAIPAPLAVQRDEEQIAPV